MLLGYLVVILVFAGIVVYGLYQGREVKARLRIPGVAFFFRAAGRRDAFSPDRKSESHNLYTGGKT